MSGLITRVLTMAMLVGVAAVLSGCLDSHRGQVPGRPWIYNPYADSYTSMQGI